MAYDEHLAQRVRALLAGNLDVTEKKMFGGLAFMCRGHMFVGIVGAELMARVGKPNYEHALSQPHVREMDFNGKPMAGYVFIHPEGILSSDDLEQWVNLCLHFIDSLPAK